jgi:hypothetical protein
MSEEIWRIAALASVGVSLALIALLALTYRRPRPVSRLLTVAYLLALPAVAALYVVVSGVAIGPFWLLAAAGLGLVLGWWQGCAGRVERIGDRLVVRNAGWYLLAWGGTCAVGQIVATIAGSMAPASVGALTLVVATAALWASKALLFSQAQRAMAQRP